MTMTPIPIRPKPIPEEVRLEAGMILARLERGTDERPERRKVIVLVRPQTVRRPKSAFDPNSEYVDVTQWIAVRMKGSTEEGVHPGLTPGTFTAGRERVLKRMYRFVGFAGDVRALIIDWDSM